MIRAYKILLFCTLKLAVLFQVFGQEYSIRHFNPEKGLNGTYIYTTIEGSVGYKWICTDFGLSRFDGLNFETIDRNDSTETNFPTAALNKRNGKVLFGYFNGTIKEFDGTELKTIFSPDENSITIRDFVEDDDGVVWVLTQNNGIIKITEKNVLLLKIDALLDKKSNSIVYQSNTLFVGTNEGLIIFQTGKNVPKYYEQVELLRGQSVLSISKRLEKNAYWIGTTNNGIYELQINSIKTDHVETEINRFDFLQNLSIVSIAESRNKDLWVGTKNNGLIKIDFNHGNTKPVQFTYLNKSAGFPGDEISTIFIDKDNAVWVGTIGDGLVQVFKNAITFYNFEKFKARSINCISGNNKHEFFFGTDIGMVKASYEGIKDSLSFRLIEDNKIKNQNVTAVHSDHNGKVYLSLKGLGLYSSDPDFKKVSKIDFKHGIKRIKIRQIVQDNNKNLWLSVMHNGIIVIDTLGNIKEQYSTKTGFFHNEIYHIHIDRKGNKWFASHGAGLAVMKPSGKIDYLTKNGSFPARDINDISEDESGNIWIGTYGNGLYEYDGKNFKRISEENGMLNNYCNAVISDRNSHIWVSHRLGLSRIDEYTNAISTVEEKDGLLVTEFLSGSIYRDIDHNIWLGNRNGVTFLNTPDEMFEPKMLGTIVTNVKIDHKMVDLYEFSADEKEVGKIPSHMTFPYDHNNLTFEYIAINLKNPKANLYQFKLDGYEREWSPTTKANFISYTNLDPGNYDFLVRQSDNPNHWSDNITRCSFTVLPSWWNTWWARVLFSGTALLLIYGIIDIRTTRLNKHLEKKKHFLEITESQNRRLKNFAFITSHNMRASTVNLSGLINMLEDEPNNKEYFNLLRKTAKKLNLTIQHVGDLLNFENKISDEEKVDCDILETIERVITLNSQSIENGEIDIEVNIPQNAKVKAIPAYLDSVYNNLITNAVRYGTKDSSKKIIITADVNDTRTIVSIQDFGLGIDMNKFGTKLFDVGTRFHSAKSDGHGIGLFMSKNQLEAMGGKIEVDSEVDKGTTIKVIF